MSLGKVIKSLSDKRTYKALELKNQLQCLIISDNDAQKSSAALSVGIGSFLDPLDTQGIAHYLQHMLFMGTAKYPEQNEYSSQLSKNAGSSNAYTSQEETNYFFEVSHGAFIESLDRFAHFFIDPLMLDASSERELNAVHSEHSKNLQNDSWRKFQLSKFLSKPGHPYTKFSTGDKTTLSNPNLREMLLNFYNSNYSSNLMKLVVYGKSDVQTLTKEVQSRFELVPNKSYQMYQMNEVPYGDKMLQKLIKIIPVKDKRTLQLTWVLSNKAPYYKFPPSKYVSHIIGHEGKGSLLSFFISEGLATSLSAGGSDSYNCYSEFEVNIGLTDKGLTKIKQIIGYVYYFIDLLKDAKPQQWVIEQIQRVNKMKFDFLQKKQGMNYCSSIAKNLHKRSIQQILSYPYFMQEFRADLISQYLNQLLPSNLIASVESKFFENECNQVEPIYGTKFAVQHLNEVSKLACNVQLPQKNIFIPDNLDILPLGTAKHPSKLFQSKFIESYYKADHQFALPKAQINLRLYFDGQNSVKQQICRTLFLKMLKEKLRQFVYMAEMAELESEVSFGSCFSINLKIAGFRDSFDKFTNQYLTQILKFKVEDKNLYETLKEKQKKQYSNYFLNNPYQLAYNSIVHALRHGGSTSPHQKLKVIDSINFEDIVNYSKYWRQTIYAEAYITGNLSEMHAIKIIKDIENIITSNAQQLPKANIGSIRPIFLPLNKICAVEEPLISKDQTNSSLIVHFQYEEVKVKTKIFQDLLLAFAKQPAFDYLRTKQQLGYVVMCLPDDNRGVLGFSIIVQSNIKSTYELSQYIEKFVNQILKQKIEELDEKTFEVYKNSLRDTKIQKDKTLSSQTARFWAQVVKHSYDFTRKQQQIEFIPTIGLNEFKQFLQNLFYTSPRRFEVHQTAHSFNEKNQELRKKRVETTPNFKIYSDVQSFIKRMSLYPDYYSHL